MYCNKCGKEMPDTAKFCGVCGAPVSGEQQTKVLRTSAGKNKEKRKNFSWMIGLGAAMPVLAVVVAGIFIFTTPKRTGFVIKYNLEDQSRYYYKNGKLVTGWFEVDGKRYYAAEEKSLIYTGHHDSPAWYEYGQLYENGKYVIGGMQYSFDERGICIGQTKVLKTEEHYYHYNGENSLEYMWNYNEAGNVTEKWSSSDLYSFIYGGDFGSYGTRIYSYDGNGNPARVEGYREDGSLWGYITYGYDTNGNIVKEEWYEDGALCFHEYSSYDRNGNLTKREEGWHSNTDEIRYYDKGNLTKLEYWDDEGNLISYYGLSYDENGNPSRYEEYDGNGNLVGYSEGSYDENGNPEKGEEYDGNGNLVGYGENSYDGNGNLIEQTDDSYDSNGNLISRTNDSYDNNGNLTKSEWYDENGNLREYRKLTYDGKENLVKDERRDENGNLISYRYYSYDDRGNLMKEESQFNNDSLSSSEYHNSYDNNGTLIRTEKYDNGVLSTAEIYDSDGDIIRKESYSSDGTMTEHTVYTYY